MKDLFTKNLGLKIVSILAAFVLWLVVVNVDDPVISKTYTGIPVEIQNEDVLTGQGKCYDIANDSGTINVVVTAHRSVIDLMSRDYIKATADLRLLTSLDTVPIEVRSTRYSDRIESVTTRDANLSLTIEDLIEREMRVSIGHEGEPEEGYLLGGVETAITTVVASGPESVVSAISTIMASADIKGINRDFTVTEPLYAYDEKGELMVDERIKLSRTVTEIKYIIYATKVIPITSGYSGNPSNGFGVSTQPVTDPADVVVAGRGENYDDMDMIYIPPDAVSVEGAVSDVSKVVDISGYLPSGVIFADPEFDPKVSVTVGIAENVRKTIEVPLSNITIDNVPDGYIANIVDIGGAVPVEIQGIGDAFDRYSGDLAIGKIDALYLVPRNTPPEGQEGAPITPGENDGTVVFDFPAGVSLVNPVSLMVVVDRVGTAEDTAEQSVMPSAGAAVTE